MNYIYSGAHKPLLFATALKESGENITIIGTGETVFHCLQAGQELEKKGIRARVLDMHTVKPVDEEALEISARETGRIIVVEEHHVQGGLGSAIAEWVVQHRPMPVKIIGIPDEDAVHGSSGEIFEYYGLTAKNIINSAIEMMKY